MQNQASDRSVPPPEVIATNTVSTKTFRPCNHRCRQWRGVCSVSGVCVWCVWSGGGGSVVV